nr:hypothetical protein [Tanacetum cinerariifolium]
MADMNAPSGQAPAMAPPVRPLLLPPPYHQSTSSTSGILYNKTRKLGATGVSWMKSGKPSGFERPRAPVLQILWCVVKRAPIDYAERIWEEFTQSIHTFLEDKQNLSWHTIGKKKATLIVNPSIWFTKLIIHHLQRRHRFHPRPDSPLYLPNEEPVLGYLKFSANGTKREVFGMPILGKKCSLKYVAASEAREAPAKEPHGPLPPVVIGEPESRKYLPLPEVPGKGKSNVTEEQVAHDLLSLQKHKKKIHADQYIFQMRISTPTGSSGHDEPSYTELEQSEREESQKAVPGADEGGQDAGAQDEGPAGLNPDEISEGQAGPNPDNAEADVQSILSLVVHAGSDRFTAMAYPKVQENIKLAVEEQVLLEDPASSSGTLSSLQHLSKDISFGDLFFSDKPLKANNDKATAKTNVESMATTIETTTTTTITPPPPPSQQQCAAEAMMMKRIGELEHIIANLIQKNKEMEERLDKHGARLYTLEQLDIPQQVSKAVSEVVTDVVDWAMQAPLRNRFRDLPEADIKEIFHQRMWETKSYKSHEDHIRLFEALKKSMNHDHSEEHAQDLAEARKKKKKSHESPQTPPGPSISLTPADLEMDEDMVLDEQAQSSDDEDIGSAHILKVNLRQDWWKPLEEERPATPEPAWLILSSDVPTGDIAIFMDWFCKRRGITELKPEDLEGLSFEIVKFFHPDVIHLQYQMEECHRLLTDSVDDPILRHNVSKPLPLGGLPGQVTIQSDFFFNKYLEYLRYDSKGSRPTLSISKIKAAYYPDAGLEQMFQRQRFYIDQHTSEGDRSTVKTHMRILSVVRIEVFFIYGYDYMKKIVLRRADLNEHVIAERDFKVQMMMRFNKIHKFSDGTLQQINEALDYRVKEFRINRINLEAIEDKDDLLQPRELCWWTSKRRRLQTSEAYRMIKSFRHSRPLSDDL